MFYFYHYRNGKVYKSGLFPDLKSVNGEVDRLIGAYRIIGYPMHRTEINVNVPQTHLIVRYSATPDCLDFISVFKVK